mgnify:CR=1 FL=1
MTRHTAPITVHNLAFPVGLLVTLGIIYANLAAYPAMVRNGVSIEMAIAKHIAAASIGVAAMFGLSHVTFDRLKSLSPFILAACIVGLALVWVPGIGCTVNQSSRWIDLRFVRVQPSEFAKLALIVYVAALVSDPRDGARTLHGLFAPLAALSLVCALIVFEPDLGTAIVVFLAVMHLLYVAGGRPKHLGWIMAVAAVLGVVMTMSADHRRHRIGAWLNPAAHRETGGFQITESLIAVAENGILGKGFARGEARHYVPAADSDYIMATVIEETGLPGLVVVLGLIGWVLWQVHSAVRLSQDRFASLAASGIGALFLWQTLINIAVVTNSIPSTGVPMPFISAGGSSLLMSLAAIGIVARPAIPGRVHAQAATATHTRGVASP